MTKRKTENHETKMTEKSRNENVKKNFSKRIKKKLGEEN